MKFALKVLFVFSLLACGGATSKYATVLDNEPDRVTKRKLDKFFAAGVEKKLGTKGVSADNFVKSAKKYLGMRHCMGGDGSKGCIDCSGLLFRTFKDVGVDLPVHGSEETARYGKIIRKGKELKKGDLVFFVRTYKTKRVITHSGIMVDNKNMIHTSTRKGVQIVPVFDNGYWEKRFVFGTRVFK